MIGLYSGLRASEASSCFTISCDTPMAPIPLIVEMSKNGDASRATILRVDENSKPIYFPGVYGRALLPHLKKKIAAKEYSIRKFLSDVKVRGIPEVEWKKADPFGHTLVHFNTPEEYEEAYKESPSPQAKSLAI